MIGTLCILETITNIQQGIDKTNAQLLFFGKVNCFSKRFSNNAAIKQSYLGNHECFRILLFNISYTKT